MTWNTADDDFDGVQYDTEHDGPASEWRGRCGQCGSRDCSHVPATDAEWLYGNSAAGLRQQAAEDLAAEFGNDVSEWLV